MGLSDLHNPQAAAELIKSFQKKFSTKKCMAPHPDHEGNIIAAHTLSLESMLRKIAVNGRVYANGGARGLAAGKKSFFELTLLGLRDVSVFNGFCQKHDAGLFLCLDQEPYRFTPQQNFTLAYRALARECYLKRKQAESLPTPEEIMSIHGIEEQMVYSEFAKWHIAASLQGAEDCENLKAVLDNYLQNSNWNRLITKAIIFPNLPTVLNTCVFQPFISFDGQQLQDFEDLSVKTSQMSFSVIPLEVGGAAVFSWIDNGPNNAPEQYFNSLVTSSNLTATIITAIFMISENFAVNPTWYDSLSVEQKTFIGEKIMDLSNGVSGEQMPRPDTDAPFPDDWGHPTITSF